MTTLPGHGLIRAYYTYCNEVTRFMFLGQTSDFDKTTCRAVGGRRHGQKASNGRSAYELALGTRHEARDLRPAFIISISSFIHV